MQHVFDTSILLKIISEITSLLGPRRPSNLWYETPSTQTKEEFFKHTHAQS